ncbi:MAG: HD domain-containing protein [Deltaproteobacteria bacterium]|nr:HD domain-containing protein [Deltaproteobacteria bacterium]
MDQRLCLPTIARCMELLDRHEVPHHIVQHSMRVAQVGLRIAVGLKEKGHDLNAALVVAGGLLHDIAKMQSILSGGDHAKAASVLLRGYGYDRIAEIAERHVAIDEAMERTAVLTEVHIVNYADKRVRHTEIVGLSERFLDLLERYGKTEEQRIRIDITLQKARSLENRIFSCLDFQPSYLCTLNKISPVFKEL